MGRQKRQCPICQSVKWRKDASSGQVLCSEGHILQDYRNETIEQSEFGPYAMRIRALNSQRNKQKSTGKANPDFYHGTRARYHYFQCLQLLLRIQGKALCMEWNLPFDEFELICRDLWALHLSLLPQPPPPEPFHHAQDLAKGSDPFISKHNPSIGPQHEPILHPGLHPGKGQEVTESLASDSETEAEKEIPHQRPLDPDPMLAALLREASDSSSGDSRLTTPPPQHSNSQPRKSRSQNRYSKPVANISILMLACWQLRIPVIYMDIISLINQYKLPYLEPVHLLPTSLTKHLADTSVSALSPKHAPSTTDLHSLTSRLAKLIWQKFRIYTPELNTAPILWRAVRALQGSALLYSMTKAVGNVVSLTLNVNRSLAPPLPRQKGYDPTYHIGDNAPPELSLVACVCLVLKMIYGFDGREQPPNDPNDPATSYPPKGELLTALFSTLNPAHLSFHELLSSRPACSPLEIKDDGIDQYLDFCERALPRLDDPNGARTGFDTIARRFSIPERGTPSVPEGTSKEHAIFSSMGTHRFLASNSSASSDKVSLPSSLPGADYIIYNTHDILGIIPSEYELVLQIAGNWVGTGKEDVGGLVERYERRIVRWWEGIRKGQDVEVEYLPTTKKLSSSRSNS